MTAQIQDTFLLEPNTQPFALVGISDEAGLFQPSRHGLVPYPLHTACYRGWYARYGLERDALILSWLAVAHSSPKGISPPALAGVLPHKQQLRVQGRGGERVEDSPEWFYEGLALPVAYTGGLLLGRGFITTLYVHMGFHPAWKYREVRELLFEQGALAGQVDRSQQMAEERARQTARGTRPKEEDLARWIEASFSRKY